MLDVMRRHSESFLIYLIFAAIIIVFAINFGPGSSSCGRAGIGASWAALVDGEPIPIQAYSRNYSWRVEMQRRRMQAAGMEFSAEMMERMGLRQQVVDQLIQDKLLAQEARRWGIQISDRELRDYIKTRYPVFDQFETRRDYESWVSRAFETTVQRFEADTRDEILGQRMHKVFMESIAVSDDELRADYLREHDRAMATYVSFDPAAIAVPESSAEAIDRVLAEEREAVETKYNNEVLAYRTKARVRARHILKALPADASDADVAKARGVLLDLKSQIEGGADFGGLADEYTDDEATRGQGGDLGTFERGTHEAALDAAVFKLKKDEITAEPVRTDRGLHLVQATEIIPPARKKLEEVEREVAAALLRERIAGERARAAAGELLDNLEKGRELEALTISEEEKRDLPGSVLPVRRETPWVLASQESIPRIGVSEELHAELFALTAEAPIASRVHEVNGVYYVVVLKERETPDLDEFEADKDSLRRYAESVKQNQVFRAWVDNLRSKASIEYNQQLFPPAEASG